MIKQSSFFAMLSRMKYINRWGLMRNTRPENLYEHSMEVAVIAHALAVLRNVRFGGQVDPGRIALMGLFHDTSEIITGDMPTPVKYYSADLQDAYKQVERQAAQRLLNMLPQDLRGQYTPLMQPAAENQELLQLIKAADKLSALIKCMEERKLGNAEFVRAEATTRQVLKAMALPEVDCFLNEFIPAYALTLDEQSGE